MKRLKSASSLQQRALSLCVFHPAPRITLMSAGSSLSGSRLRAASLSDKRSAGSANSSGRPGVCGPLLCSNYPKQSSPRSSQLLLPTSKIPFSCEPALNDTSQLQTSKRHIAVGVMLVVPHCPATPPSQQTSFVVATVKEVHPHPHVKDFPSKQLSGSFHICPAAGLTLREGLLRQKAGT